MAIIAIKTMFNTLLLEVDVDPTSGGGVQSPVGSIVTVNDGSALFFKTGAGATAYTKIPVTTAQILAGIGVLPVANGGTNKASYTIGDILYASAAGVLTALTAGATGTFPMYQGAGVAPIVSTLKLPNSSTANYLVWSSATNTYSENINVQFNTSTGFNVGSCPDDGISFTQVAGGSLHINRGADNVVFLNITASSSNRFQISSDVSGNVKALAMSSGNLGLGVNTTVYLSIASTGVITVTDASNIAVGSTTGTQIATATTQKLGVYGATPIVQRSGSAQVAVVTTGSTQAAPFGYATAAQADGIVTLVNELRAWAVAQGWIKGSA